MDEKRLLELALDGLRVQREKIDREIDEVKSRLSDRDMAGTQTQPPKKQRTISEEQKRKMAAGTRRRWAKWRKEQAKKN